MGMVDLTSGSVGMGISMGIPMGIPVGMEWVWGLKCHPHGSPGFSGTADRTALFTVRTNPRWRRPPSWKNFKWPYLHFMFGYRVGFWGTADLMALFSIRTNSRWRWIISNGHISTTAHDLLI